MFAIQADRRRRQLLSAVFALVAGLHFPVTGYSQGLSALSLEDALRLAEQRSSRLTAQDFAATAAREQEVAAGQLPDPILKAGINNLPVNGADRFSVTSDFMTMRSVGVAQELTREAKRKARARRFASEAELALAARQVALAELRRDTALAWLDRYFQERMRTVLVAQREESTLQVEAAQSAYRSGRGSQAEVFAARSAVAQIDDRLQQVERQISVAGITLARWIGSDAGLALQSPPALTAIRLPAKSLESDLLAHHPELSMLAQQERVARADADLAQSARQTDVSVELMYSQRGPAYSNMLSFNVSIPLQWDQARRQDREVAAKLAIVEQRRSEREEATREHIAQTRGWLRGWQTSRDRLSNYDATLIPLAAERTRAALTAYRGNVGSLSGVLEARRLEIDARMDRLRIEMEAASYWAQLEYLIPPGHLPVTEESK